MLWPTACERRGSEAYGTQERCALFACYCARMARLTCGSIGNP